MAWAVDYKALKDSQKALCVILILAIIAATSYFFYKVLDRRFQFFNNTRKFVIVILTWGDLFIAIFSLFVRARLIYERRYITACSTLKCAEVYSMYYFPFVYATGLICLCVERVFRQRIRNFFPKPEFCSVAVAGIPWLLGLILILPLTLAGMDWIHCSIVSNSSSNGREAAMILNSVILPSTFAVICCIIAKLVKFDFGRFTDPEAQTISGAQYQPEPNVDTYGDAPSQPAPHSVDQGQLKIYTYGNVPSQPVPNPQSTQAPPGSTYRPLAGAQPVPNPQSNQALPGSTYTSLAGAQQVPNSNHFVLEALVEKEKTSDLLVASLFFIFTMPYALFILISYLDDDVRPVLDPVPFVVIKELFYWMLFARSAVLPIVWARVTSHVI